MLQQTQVDTVIPYYRRWLKRFPTLAALAAAPLQAVLTLWEGLGYYSRARNLHRAAQKIVAEHQGRLPRAPAELRALPGIGRYTAAAIASIAFNADVAVLDGNVKRVLARVFDFREDVKSPAGEKKLWVLAESLVPAGRAGDYNQALMDLGATVCTPRTPACGTCPLRAVCAARRLGVQLERPVTPKRSPVPHQMLVSAVIRKQGRVFITQRPANQLLGGLWAFPAFEILAAALPATLLKNFGLRVQVSEPLPPLTHAYTHFRVTQHVYACRWQSGAAARGQWVRLFELGDYPMGKIDRQIALYLQEKPAER